MFISNSAFVARGHVLIQAASFMKQDSCTCSRCMTFSPLGFHVRPLAGNGCISWFGVSYSVKQACLILTCVTILRSSGNLLALFFWHCSAAHDLSLFCFSVYPCGILVPRVGSRTSLCSSDCKLQLNVGVFQTTSGLNSCVLMSFCSITILHGLSRCGSGAIFSRVPTTPICLATRNNNNNWQDLKRLCRT